MLSAGNSWYIGQCCSVCHITPDLHTCLYPHLSPQFPWHNIYIFPPIDYVQLVWAESYIVGCLDYCSMIAFIHPDWCSIRTAPSMTCLTSVTQIFFVNLVPHVGYTFSFYRNRQDDIMVVGHWSTWFRVYNVRMAHMTPCTCTDTISCLTIWSINWWNSWHVAKSVYQLLFNEIYYTNWPFGIQLLLLRLWSHQHCSSELDFCMILHAACYIQG